MKTTVSATKAEMGKLGGAQAGEAIRAAIAANGAANIILATGASQFDTLAALVEEKDIDWSKVAMFHLDEYIGLPVTHGASFRKYLTERFIEKVDGLGAAHLVNGDADDPKAECARLGELIAKHPIDVALVGIGENGHLAFNDPPADFDTEEAYLVVDLDEACRKQQLGEGWFPTFDDVPKQAISMSIKQIMKSKIIICSVPDERKADAVKGSLEGPVTNTVPASIMQQHPDCRMLLDEASASKLSK